MVLASDAAHAQFTLGARSLAMGQTGVALPDDPWALYANPSLIETDNNRVSFYGFRYLGISDISDFAVAANTQTRFGTIAGGIHRFGFDLFNESRFRVAYKNSADRFHYGGALTYTHVNQGGGFGSAGAFGLDVGIAAEVIDGLWFGARSTNINQPTFGSTDEQLPRESAIGISYRLSSLALFTTEIVKDVRFPISYRGGVEIELVESLFARAGVTTEPETYSFGFGYATSRILINVGVQQHVPLGLSPALDLGINF
ncbi:MAG: hypothetical protein ACNA78_02765 [Balneolaceae bacterium]